MTLTLALGLHSCAGEKSLNQDFCAGVIPATPLLCTKGAAVALADGVSSSTVSQIASETAVTSFLDDYFCTSDTASVKQAGGQVLQAIHAWLYGQSRQVFGHDPDKGYVCTFSGWVVKGRFAHLFHIGDSRAYLWRQGLLTQISSDHSSPVLTGAGHSAKTTYLSRALGAGPQINYDYIQVALREGDILLLLTDGVYANLSPSALSALLAKAEAKMSMPELASSLTAAALAAQSEDNLSAALLQIKQLPEPATPPKLDERLHVVTDLAAGSTLDGYTVIRALYQSHRSHVYLVQDEISKQLLVLKTPATEQMSNEAYLARLLLEDWIARRVRNDHVIRSVSTGRERRYIYTLAEFIQGQTLQQWRQDHPHPSLEQVRQIVMQVGTGLQALHRAEVVHQDLRPENIMITETGLVKIIDLGSAQVAGLVEQYHIAVERGLGTALYSAPECLLGEEATQSADLYSLAVLCYYLLSGRFPYGHQLARCRNRQQQKRLCYQPLSSEASAIPRWFDLTLQQALQPDPAARYQQLSAFLYDLQHPNPAYLQQPFRPLLQRDPLRFWQVVSLILLLLNLTLCYQFLL
ncbi:bifunctional serine/threonine-protein phosphatase/kinase [Rheinheimera sp. UJ51]|uniref:bifunctional protein-serine/threonine kinase/phosphatase n=1 Tax=Rheinheimera sp. UJ51 TaxID=2892446 RepID=UPI001E383A6B|nr:bifunctional protein-serine/threonine kinase/phosphatase [Rheinheimera sp. UJ51]MCC5451539.1 bifunctional serine/threonine-protein phosphatase/kinase [Rheinheimera sp. UJ51]